MRTPTPPFQRKFPCRALLLDAGPLIRFYKCDALPALTGITRLEAAGQVITEFNRVPGQRDSFRSIRVKPRRIIVGSEEWKEFSRIRGARTSNLDMGEDETIAIALAERSRGRVLPIAVFDKIATREALREGLIVVDFLGLLCWSVASGAISVEQADAIETRASAVNGWKRPPGYSGSVRSLVEPYCLALVEKVRNVTTALKAGQRARKPDRR